MQLGRLVTRLHKIRTLGFCDLQYKQYKESFSLLFILQAKKKLRWRLRPPTLPTTTAYPPTLMLEPELLAVDVLVVASGLLCFLWVPDFSRASKKDISDGLSRESRW